MACRAPFSVVGAPNVILETIKRGEDDFDVDPVTRKDNTTVILRLYEAFGGHASARLVFGRHLSVVKAFETNLLEQESRDVDIMASDSDSSGGSINLEFHGFEVKTVKLVLRSKGKKKE